MIATERGIARAHLGSIACSGFIVCVYIKSSPMCARRGVYAMIFGEGGDENESLANCGGESAWDSVEMLSGTRSI